MKDLRKEIDSIDRELADLLNRRLDVVKKIGAYKLARGIPVLDEEREKEKLQAFAEQFDKDRKKCGTRVMEAVMEVSRNYQKDKTFEYALLGSKLGHSFSPQVHRMLGGYEYGLIEMDEEELEGFFKAFPMKGISVTMPYKRKVMKYCDEISDHAKATNSVNTIVKNSDGTLSGYNTDYDGFRYTVERSGVRIRGEKCLILGSGGVSGTVKKVLEDLEAGEIITISRRGSNNYDNIARHEDAAIIVNATPVGMYPNTGSSPVDIGIFKNCKGIFDLIYNPLRSRLMLEGQDRGIPAFSGMHMLVAQAACACKLFTGEDRMDRIDGVCEQMEKDMENIVLIGMPGSGKTSIGRKLGEMTGKVFIDSDELIRTTFGKTAEEIIISEGEEAFRKKEMKVIDSAAKIGGRVIATGGGVVEREENRDPLRSNGRIVYIKRDLDKLSRESRPISGARGIENLYDERKDKYESWQDLTVENRDIDEAAENILEGLGYR